MLTNSYKFLDRDVVTFINKTIEAYQNFSEERFQLWIEMNDVESKMNPSAYVNKCFLKELKSGTFIKPEKQEEPELEHINLSAGDMFNVMRARGIKVSPTSTGNIMTTCEYLINHRVLTIQDLRKLNHDIVDYLAENNMTSDDFVDLMKKSNSLRGKVNLDEVDIDVRKFQEEWDSMMKSYYEDLTNTK